MVQSLWETVWHFLKTLTIDLSCDLEILLLVSKRRENIGPHENLNTMLPSGLFTGTKRQK